MGNHCRENNITSKKYEISVNRPHVVVQTLCFFETSAGRPDTVQLYVLAIKIAYLYDELFIQKMT